MAFGGLSTRQNVQIAVDRTSRRRSDVDRLLTEHDLLDFTDTRANDLPQGILRRLGIALAMASRPHLLLLDEPAAGLNDHESGELAQLLVRLQSDGPTIMVVDHDMQFLMPICQRVVVLDEGRLLADGTPQQIQRNPEVIACYLGSAHVER
jgi:branched-chain amino acid transport system ATP-binding protein